MMLSRSEYEEVLEMRRECTALRAELKLAAAQYWGFKAGFRGNQPRWPIGTPGTPKPGGRWSGGAGVGNTSGQTIDLSAMARKPLLFDLPRLPNAPLPVPYVPTDRVSGKNPRGPVHIENNAQTGISTVDETTEKLKTILEDVVSKHPTGSGSEYGKRIHYDFGDAVKVENLRGIGTDGVEHTFPEGTRYGSKASVRTDVILRNDVGDVTAIYDVKTGTASLDRPRVRELRLKTGTGPEIPMIEMHIQRGLSLKARTENGHYFWIITLRLWNPWIRGIAGRQADASSLSNR
jgi:hypothetical protein